MYPEHKYSKYIDTTFSFDNRVYPNESKLDLVDALKNMRCNGDIMLEPRLQEYIKKKKHYKENNIDPCVPLEKEYQIGSRDMKIIQSFLSGNRDIYSEKNLRLKDDEKIKKQKYFPSKEYRDNDPRVQKVERGRHQYKHPDNMGMFYPDQDEAFYEGPVRKLDPIMDARDLEGQKMKFAPTGDYQIDPNLSSRNNTPNKYKSEFRVSEDQFINLADKEAKTKKHHKHKKHVRFSGDSDPDPRNQYMFHDMNLKPFTQDGKIAPADYNMQNYSRVEQSDLRYGQPIEDKYSEQSNMDLNNKINLPNMGSKSKRDLNTGSYQMMPFFDYDDKNTLNSTLYPRDITLETEMIRGMRSTGKRSFGLRNPEEHYFSYVDAEFNNPTNSVEAYPRGGEASRLSNKTMARQKYTREIM